MVEALPFGSTKDIRSREFHPSTAFSAKVLRQGGSAYVIVHREFYSRWRSLPVHRVCEATTEVAPGLVVAAVVGGRVNSLARCRIVRGRRRRLSSSSFPSRRLPKRTRKRKAPEAEVNDRTCLRGTRNGSVDIWCRSLEECVSLPAPGAARAQELSSSGCPRVSRLLPGRV